MHGSARTDIAPSDAARSLLFARATAAQTTDIAAGDHLKFGSSDFRQGTQIELQTAAYPALGRVALQPGSLYRLTGCVPNMEFAADDGAVQYAWTLTDGTQLTGMRAGGFSSTRLASMEARSAIAPAVIDLRAALVVTTVELRIVSVTDLAALGVLGLLPWCWIEEM